MADGDQGIPSCMNCSSTEAASSGAFKLISAAGLLAGYSRWQYELLMATKQAWTAQDEHSRDGDDGNARLVMNEGEMEFIERTPPPSTPRAHADLPHGAQSRKASAELVPASPSQATSAT